MSSQRVHFGRLVIAMIPRGPNVDAFATAFSATHSGLKPFYRQLASVGENRVRKMRVVFSRWLEIELAVGEALPAEASFPLDCYFAPATVRGFSF
jgi:hypothetical protein